MNTDPMDEFDRLSRALRDKAPTPDPAARAASTPPAGIAMGKFHGGVTTVRRSGTNTAPGTRSSSRAVAA